MRTIIRIAKFRDIPAIKALAEEAHGRSPYADCPMDAEKLALVARQAISSSFAGQAANSVILVADDGEVHGVFVGAVMSLYECLDVVWATNSFWYVRKGGNARSAFRLLDAFHEWTIRRYDHVVFRVGLNATLNPTEGLERLMRHRGFTRSGVIVEKEYRKCQQVDS
jgi:hypothetical protein